MNLALELRFAGVALRPTVAWFIPGSHPADWLGELTRGQIAGAATQLLPLAADSDSQYFGLLAVLPDEQSRTMPPKAIPFGRCGDRLFIPTHAKFEPVASDAEAAELLPDDEHLYVWHPRQGLTRFSPADCLSVADLLVAPTRRPEAWDAALPGVALNTHLTSIVWESPPTFETMWEASRDDIGSEELNLDRLPPSPWEGSGGSLGRIGRSLSDSLAGITHWLTKLAPANANHPTWVNKLQAWAQEKKSRIAAVNEAERNREIARLLHMLGTSPDEGLRFSVPLTQFGGRGVAPPSNRLAPRDVNFNLRRLGAGGPVDAWHIDQSYRQKLSAKYRELANREIRLGRYRRAAYIFGELLGDFVSAAKALDDGQHFREAAMLYEERLRQPRAAGECLERGGLWPEAIELFTRLKEFERVGKIHRKLDQGQAACAAYRLAVDARLEAHDFLGAAELLERELGAADEAMEQLKAGWRDGRQSERCLRESFRFLARHGRHDEARDYIRELRGSLPDAAKVLMFANGLVEIALSYPDAEIRHFASDQTRTLAAERLPSLGDHECHAVLTAVGRLVQHDRLLRHDVRRFVEHRFARKSVPKTPTRDKIRLLRSFDLPAAIWRTAVSLGDCFVAAGWNGRELSVVRSTWDGTFDRPVHDGWRIPHREPGPPIMLAADPQNAHGILVHARGERAVYGRRYFVPREKLPEGLAIGPHPGLSMQSVALSYGGQGMAYVVELASSELIVNTYAAMSDALVNSWAIDLENERADDPPLLSDLPQPLFVRDGVIYLAIGSKIVKCTSAGKSGEFECPAQVRALSGSLPHTRPRIVAALERGGKIFWDAPSDRHEVQFAKELCEPSIGLTRAGWLIAAARNEIEVYSTERRQLFLHGQIASAADKPVAILGNTSANDFAVLEESGKVSLYRIT